MLTLFTTCKPFVGQAAVHQHNALASWALGIPGANILVFGNEEGVMETCFDLGLWHLPCKRDESGLPRLDSMFTLAQEVAEGGPLAWCNADIIVAGGLEEAVFLCAEKFPDGFLMACRRWDIDLDQPLNFTSNWRAEVRGLIESGGELYTPCSSDLFAWLPPLPFEMPPFVAGRPRWDNWTLWAAAEHGLPVVDATRAVTLAHPRHGFAQGSRKARDKDATSGPNKELAGTHVWCLVHVKRAGALWEMDENGSIKKVT